MQNSTHERTLESELDSNEERRKVRSALKNEFENISKNKAELRDLKSDRFQKDLRKLDAISTRAVHTREMQMDAFSLRELSLAAKAQATQISKYTNKYDFKWLSLEIQKLFGLSGQTLDWAALGRNVLHTMNDTAPFSSILGSLSKESKKRKPIQRKEKVVEEENEENAPVAPSEVKQGQNGDEKDDNIAIQRSSHQQKKLEELTKRSKDKPVDLLQLLIDPRDPVQTIENFFDYSFLLKQKKVEEDIDSVTGLPSVVLVNDATTLEEGECRNNQMVLSINMADLARLSEAMGHEDGLLHRNDALYTANSVREQLSILTYASERKRK